MTNNILVVEDTDSLREALANVLSHEGYSVQSVTNAEDALEEIKTNNFSLVLCDLKLPKENGLHFLTNAKKTKNELPIVVMTAYGNIEIAVEAMKLGAVDFITKPFEPENLCKLIERIVSENKHFAANKFQHPLIFQSPEMAQVIEQAKKVAPLSTPVLILGESGTGKELLAKLIHLQSTRNNAQFVAINCASLPGELLESEFFGHEAGSFTGAFENKIGLFEEANHGTIFLDEIGTMPQNLQIKLLRTLQESEIKKLGSTKTKKIDTRVLSATNCDLSAEIKTGRFREDLYYRLGVVILDIPPLRKRNEDILLLANYFLKYYSKEFKKDAVVTLSDEVKEALRSYHWPGNVRELQHVIEHAMIFSEGPIGLKDLNLPLSAKNNAPSPADSLHRLVADTVRSAEKSAITTALKRFNGNKSQAARALGVSYKTLLNKVKEYALEKEEDKRVPNSP